MTSQKYYTQKFYIYRNLQGPFRHHAYQKSDLW